MNANFSDHISQARFYYFVTNLTQIDLLLLTKHSRHETDTVLCD